MHTAGRARRGIYTHAKSLRPCATDSVALERLAGSETRSIRINGKLKSRQALEADRDRGGGHHICTWQITIAGKRTPLVSS